MSGSSPLTSRENGAVHEMVIEVLLFSASRFPTDASKPVSSNQNIIIKAK